MREAFRIRSYSAHAGVYDQLVGVRIRLLGPVGAWDGQRAIQVCVSGLRSALPGADGLDVQLAGGADARAHAAAALAVHRETGHVLGQSRAGRLLELLGEV